MTRGSRSSWLPLLLLPLLAQVLPASIARADILRVPVDFNTLAVAIDSAGVGDTLQVYGNGGATFYNRYEIDKDLTIQGGWRADFQVRDPEIYVTVVRDPSDGFEFQRAIFQIRGSPRVIIDGIYVIGGRFGVESAEGADLEVRNCVFRDQLNVGFGDESRAGGGVRVLGGSLVLEDTEIRNIRSDRNGAGVAVIGSSSAVVRGCEIRSTSSLSFTIDVAARGAGIYVIDTGNLLVENTTLAQCSSFDDGGLVYVRNTSVSVVDCTLDTGFATGTGGGAHFTSCPSVSLSGTTVRNCSTSGQAGGIWVDGSGFFTLEDSFIHSNLADDSGAGLRLESTPFTIRTTEFYGNFLANPSRVALWGGGVRSLTSDGLVEDSQFHDERAGTRGGAWSQIGGDVTFRRCRFERNVSSLYGGAIDLELGGSIHVEHCLFTANDAKFGGALAGAFAAALSVDHSTFTGNSGRNGGAALFVETAASASVSNSILCCATRGELVTCSSASLGMRFTNVWNDDAVNPKQEFSHGCPDPIGADGNITANPLFCDPQGPDYTLSSASPCAGTAEGGTDMGWAGTGCAGTVLSVRPDSWGAIKARYRDSAR